MDRILTWAEGLDEMCGGGFPENGCYLVAGEPGSGRTVSALTYVTRNADLGRPGVFVTAEETPTQLREDAESLDLPLRELEEDGMIRIVDVTATHIEIPSREAYCLDSLGGVDDLLDTLVAAQEDIGAACLSLDSADALLAACGPGTSAAALARLSLGLQTLGFTSLFTGGTESDAAPFTQGLVRLHHSLGTDRVRGVEVRKLRATEHDREVRPFAVESGGVSVEKDETLTVTREGET